MSGGGGVPLCERKEGISRLQIRKLPSLCPVRMTQCGSLAGPPLEKATAVIAARVGSSVGKREREGVKMGGGAREGEGSE